MFIVPMNGITPLNILSQVKPVEKTENEFVDGAGSFGDIFKNALMNVQDAQAAASSDSISLALGEVDNLEQIYINKEKAGVALETFVAIKNSAISAYDEVMRMSI